MDVLEAHQLVPDESESVHVLVAKVVVGQDDDWLLWASLVTRAKRKDQVLDAFDDATDYNMILSLKLILLQGTIRPLKRTWFAVNEKVVLQIAFFISFVLEFKLTRQL